MEYDHRDLIPPWGHGLIHGEEGKSTMTVCFDRNGGALPSRRTGMVCKDNDGRASHGRHKANSMRCILQHTCNIWQTATGTGVQNRLTFRASRAQMYACLQLIRATFPPNQGFIRAFWAKNRLNPGKTGRKRRRKGDYGGHCMAQQPSLRTLQCWSERYSAEKQQLELAGREGLFGPLPG